MTRDAGFAGRRHRLRSEPRAWCRVTRSGSGRKYEAVNQSRWPARMPKSASAPSPSDLFVKHCAELVKWSPKGLACWRRRHAIGKPSPRRIERPDSIRARPPSWRIRTRKSSAVSGATFVLLREKTGRRAKRTVTSFKPGAFIPKDRCEREKHDKLFFCLSTAARRRSGREKARRRMPVWGRVGAEELLCEGQKKSRVSDRNARSGIENH